MPLSFPLCIFFHPLFIESLPPNKLSLFPLFFHSSMAFFHLFFFLLFTTANGGATNLTATPPPPSRTTAFKPGIIAIVGILTTIFSVTFLLLMYMKHCKRSRYTNTSRGYPPSRRNSGIDRKVIASLPMFRFSSLRGQKDGLECAVCLNKFDPDEVLRLLPKCRHAFHVECIDTWLEAHSTCPLCRYRVDPEDVLLILCNHVTPRGSDQEHTKPNPRVSGRHSSAGEGGTLPLEINDFPGRVSLDSWSSRRKTGDGGSVNPSSWKSFMRKSGNDAENTGRRGKQSRKDGQLPVQGENHRLEHRIIVGEEEEGRRRWSDVQAAESLYLRWEMVVGGGGSGRGVINGRSVSEITGVSRYRSNNGGKEEREREGWLAWISQSQQQHHQNPAGHSSSSPPPILL